MKPIFTLTGIFALFPLLALAHGGEEHSALVTFVSSLLDTEQGSGLLLIILVGILVGALHALEGGHSKTLLAALVVDNRVDLRQGLIYVAVFVLAHLSDIFLIGLALFFLADIEALQAPLADAERLAVFAMVAIASWLLLREISRLSICFYRSRLPKPDHHHHHHSHPHHHTSETHISTRGQLTLAFLEGLAPCPTGWALLFLVVALGQFWLIVPLVGAFAIGIGLVLTVLLLFLLRFRDLVQKRVAWFGTIAPLLSASFLLLISLILLRNLY